MDFVNRAEELGRLRRLSGSREGGLAVIWGRRRVGKTRLLVEWLRGGTGVYSVADASAASVQRRYLARAIEERLPGFGEADFPDWGTLFDRLAREAARTRWRGPLVLDEIPYLVEASPELPSVIQRFVDHGAREADFTLALSGSSQRMMQGLVLAGDAPLYGRAKEIVKIEPMRAGYLGPALGLGNAEAAVSAYAAWGGIPRYWELAAPFRRLADAVDALVLDPLGPLHDEPTRLLLEELPPAAALRPVLDAIGAGAHRLSEIAGRLGQPATSLARPLARLQELGFVTREIPFGEPERSGKRALYKLSDPFLRLWFTLVAPRRGWLARATRAARRKLIDRALPRLRSLAWEDLCREAVPRLKLGRHRFGVARRFWLGDGPEWDVVAESEDRSELLLGEVSWEGSPLEKLKAKGVPELSHRPGRIRHAIFTVRSRKARRDSDVSFVDARAVLSALR